MVHLNLTREGRSVYLQIVPMALRYEAQILGILDENEREQLDRILTKLQHGVDDLSVRS